MTTPAPSQVLCIKTMGMPEEEFQQNIEVFSETGSVVIYYQRTKHLAFVQFPTLNDSANALDYISSGNLCTTEGKPLQAEYSKRQSVTTKEDKDKADKEKGGRQSGSKTRFDGKKPAPNGLQMPSPLENPPAQRLPAKRPRFDRAITSVPEGPPKKAGRFEDSPASPVLCVKTDMEEDELRQWISKRLPKPTDILMNTKKQMAFVQYRNVNDSTRVLDHIVSGNFVTGSGYVISACYSKRQCIERKGTRESGGALPRLSSTATTPVTMPIQPKKAFTSSGVRSSGPPKQHHQNQKQRVLLVTLRPVSGNGTLTVDNALATFARCGMVEKIILFISKSDEKHLQALVQYNSPDHAQLAISRYHEQVMGDFELQIGFSKQHDLEVKQNTDRMRDFTNPFLNDAASAIGIQV